MKHGLKYIMFYVQKDIAPLWMWYNPPLVRNKPLGVPASMKGVYWRLSMSQAMNEKSYEDSNPSVYIDT